MRRIIYEGRDANDTWTWDGVSWNELTLRRSPTARESHSMVLFPPTGQIILFGGFTGRRYLGDTWAFGPAATHTPTLQDGPSPGGRWTP